MTSSSSLFMGALRKCGIDVMIPDEGSSQNSLVYITCGDEAKAFRQLDALFRIQQTQVDDMLKSMVAFFEIPGVLTASLHSLDDDADEPDKLNSNFRQEETFLKLLLRIESLQDTLIEVLLGNMMTVEAHSENDMSQMLNKKEEPLRIQMQIFNHIRWCELLFSPEKVVLTLLDSALVLSQSLQIEIIMSIPAILPHSVADDILERLLGLAQTSPALLPCILETFGNLCLQPGSESFKKVIRFAIEELNSADLTMLPALTRFLLECTCAVDTTELVWHETRAKLVHCLDSSLPSDSEDISEQSQSQEWLDFQSILISLLKSVFATSSSRLLLFQSMITEITPEGSCDESPALQRVVEDLKTLDVWLLLALTDIPTYKTKVLTCLIKQVEWNRLSASLVHTSLIKYPAVASFVFSSALICGQSLLSYHRVGKQNSLHCAHILGVWLYQALYNSTADSMSVGSRRQEILIALVGHISSPVQKEADSALEVLSSLAQAEHISSLQEIHFMLHGELWDERTPSSTASLRVYLPFIKSLLEDIQSLQEHQQRLLFRVIFQCAMGNPDRFRPISKAAHDSSSTFGAKNDIIDMTEVVSAPIDDVMILLKKYASSMDTSLRKIGILGHTAQLIEEALLQSVVTGKRNCDKIQCTASQLKGDDERKESYVERLEALLDMTASDTEGHVYLLQELTAQIELYSSVLKDTALIRFLRFDVEDQLFQYIGGLDLDNAESHIYDGKETSDNRVISREEYLKLQQKHLRCMPSSLYFDINGIALSPAYAKIFPTVLSDIRRRKELEAMQVAGTASQGTAPGQYLCPLLEPILYLVTACERCMGGNLTELGLLLGIPLELPRKDILDVAEDFGDVDREVICSSLFYGVVWLRSLLNIFTHMEYLPREQHYKLVLRMNQLVDLEKALYQHIQRFPQFLEILCPKTHKSVGRYNLYTGKRVNLGGSKQGKQTKSEKSTTSDEKKNATDSGKRAKGVGANRIILTELQAFMENSVFKALSYDVNCILGVGVEPLVYIPETQLSSTSQVSQQEDKSLQDATMQLVARLNDAAILKLLKNTVRWSKIVDAKFGLDSCSKVITETAALLHHGVFRSMFVLIGRVKRTIGSNFNSCVVSSSLLESTELPAEHNLNDFSQDISVVCPLNILEEIATLLLNLLSNQELKKEFFGCVKLSEKQNIFTVPLIVRIFLHLSGVMDDEQPVDSNNADQIAKQFSVGLQTVFDSFSSLAVGVMAHRDSAPGPQQGDLADNRYGDCTNRPAEEKFDRGSDNNMRFVVTCLRILDSILDLHAGFVTTNEGHENSVVQTVKELIDPQCLPSQFSDLCQKMLQSDWTSFSSSTSESHDASTGRSSHCSKDISLCVALLLKYSPDPLEKVIFLTNELFLGDLKFLHPTEVSESYPTLSIESCVYYYQPMLQALTHLWDAEHSGEAVKNVSPSLRNGAEFEDDERSISNSAKVVECFTSLIMLTKYEGNSTTKAGKGINRRAMLMIALHEGRVFMESFMRTSKSLHVFFSRHQEDVSKMLSRLQKATRQLQSVALYAKRSRDKMLSQEGPRLKKVLEQVIYCMKDMAQDCVGPGSIYVGNLKSRDISGKEIIDESDSSDESSSNESTNSDSEEENESEIDNDENDEPPREHNFGVEDEELGKVLSAKRFHSQDRSMEKADLSQLFREKESLPRPPKRLRQKIVDSGSSSE